jgi:hypothetical protein
MGLYATVFAMFGLILNILNYEYNTLVFETQLEPD